MKKTLTVLAGLLMATSLSLQAEPSMYMPRDLQKQQAQERDALYQAREADRQAWREDREKLREKHQRQLQAWRAERKKRRDMEMADRKSREESLRKQRKEYEAWAKERRQQYLEMRHASSN